MQSNWRLYYRIYGFVDVEIIERAGLMGGNM